MIGEARRCWSGARGDYGKPRPASLSNQATQSGPIGVSFAFFTFMLASVLVYVSAPLLVVTWTRWRDERKAAVLAAE